MRGASFTLAALAAFQVPGSGFQVRVPDVASEVRGLQQRELYIEVVGSLSADQRSGIELGGSEMAQTARLVGANVTIRFDIAKPPRPGRIGVIARDDGIHGDVPTMRLAAAARVAPNQERCRFQIPASDREALSWHASLTRFGASELNERFTKRFGRPMTSDAWNGWFAVKALVETALRNTDERDMCEALLRGRFDGHKGRSLSFDPDTGVLRQPLYSIGPGGQVIDRK
jgi:hypothetical protein